LFKEFSNHKTFIGQVLTLTNTCPHDWRGIAIKLEGLRGKVIRIQTLRRIVQLASFILIYSAMLGLGPIPLLLPILSGMGVQSKTMGEAFGFLQYLLYQTIFPWAAIASFLIFAIIFNRALCGWVCPFGFVQDILAYFKRRHLRVSPDSHRSLLWIKYILLGAVLFVSITLSVSLVAGVGENYKRALGPFSQVPFNVLSPADTFFAVIPRMALDLRYAIYSQSFWGIVSGIGLFSPLLWARLVILIATLVIVVYVPRGWCKYFCPNGALMAIFSRFSFLGLKRELTKCTRADCRICVEACPMNVRITELSWEKFNDPECIYCLKCVDECPTKALKPKFP